MGLTKPRAAQIFDLDYKQSTRAVTTTNITLSGGAPSQVDSVNLNVGDRILVTGQSTGSQNGIYKISVLGTGANGTWIRSSDGDTTGEIESGMIVMVTEGAIYADTQWKLITDDPITIGSTALIFTQNYSANSVSGGTSNVVVYSNANVTISSNGTANVLAISDTGIYVTGLASVSGNVTGGNINLSGNIVDTGALTIITGSNGNIALSPNGTGIVTVSGNISAVGNIAGNYFIGNGSQLTGITVATSYGDSNVVSLLASFGSNNISTTGNITAGNVNTPSADLAEMYVSDNSYPAGTVVEFGGQYEITVTTNSHSTRVAGVVSTDPGHIMNSAQSGVHVLPVALTGRVPCRVIGIIVKGDRLVASGHAGVAQRLDPTQYQPGCIIGKSLQDYNSEQAGTIEIAVGRF